MLRSGFKLLGLWLLFQASVQAANPSECITLKSVHIEASEILDESARSDLIVPFLGGCLDEGLVRAVLSAISNDFIARGYVTSRPYLLEQDISDGRIEIRILVGMVEAIVDADSGTSNARIKTAFLFSDRILNLRDLETSLEIMERAESVTASFEIRPGAQPGGSVVAIKTLQSNRFHGELGAIAQSDFDSQLSFQATLDNPFNINDIVELRYNSGEAFQSIQSDRSRELVYSFPLGSYLIALNHSDSDFKQRVQGISSSFIAEGNTVSDELRVSKLLTRSQTGKLSLAFALKIKDSNNFFEEQ
ncbi:MAG: ShlB/FhaC/HecB family hemolysin secretion/activation protein, partial [Gammaproteobacteria bacterium]|nr:ShlB/FhaC/HecB family hemolysin secretion/activation protein [Gammaproteobacteria bacterium]